MKIVDKIPMFGLGLGGKSPNVSTQKRINLYPEVSKENEKTKLALFCTPGLTGKYDFGARVCRGARTYKSLAYMVVGNGFYEYNNANVAMQKGTLLTSNGRVSISDNGFQIIVVDGANGYIYTPGLTSQTIASITNVGTTATLTTVLPHGISSGIYVTVSGATPSPYNGLFQINVTGLNTYTYNMLSDPGGNASVMGSYTVDSFQRITAAGFPGATTVTFLAGYFITTTPNSGQYQWSGIYNGFSWNALDFATAESNPDDLVSAIADSGFLYLFGTDSIQVQSVSGYLDKPFNDVSGGGIEFGLAARWSLCKFNDSLMFLRKSRLGQVQLAKILGSSTVPVSNPDWDYIVNNYPSVSDATAYSYMLGGHPMYQINFPSANKSWLFDGLNGSMQELQSGTGRHRGEIQFSLVDKPYVTDFERGNVYLLDATNFTDNGEYIAREFIGVHNMTGNISSLSELWLEIQAGMGDAIGQGSNPMIMMQISKDGGHTFGNERWVPMGKVGEYKVRPRWRRNGRARDWVCKFRWTDPVMSTVVEAWGRFGG